MKALNLSPWTALVLKVAGAALVITSLVDYFILLSTAKFDDSQWVLTFTGQVVDRGFIPLVGLALIFVSVWLDGQNGGLNADRPSHGLRIASLIIATFLGVSFLLIVPWSVMTTGKAADDQVKKIEEQGKQVLEQLKQAPQQQLDAEIAALEQAVKSGEFQGKALTDAERTQAQQELDRRKKLKTDPKAFDAEVAPQLDKEKQKLQTEQDKQVGEIRWNALRAGMRTGLNSLLWAIGYTIIGWTGLRQVR